MSNSPFLEAWDSRVRSYSQFFDAHSKAARQDIASIKSSPFTSWRDVSQTQDRYWKLDSLNLRQQLGEITSQEVSEVNRVLGGNPITGYFMTLSTKEPSLLKAWNLGEGLLWAGVGGAFGAYGRFVRGYNNLWLIAAGLPVLGWTLIQSHRQPTTHINNAYRYLIAKRAATAEFEANQARLAQNEWAQSAEYASL